MVFLLEERIEAIPDDKTLTVGNVAAVFGVHPDTIRDWVSRGFITPEPRMTKQSPLQFSKRSLLRAIEAAQERVA